MVEQENPLPASPGVPGKEFDSRVVPATPAIATMLATVVFYERLRGRVWWCQQGDWSPLSIAVNSPHNSQHLFDAYTFSHILHGILFFGMLWLVRRRLSFTTRLIIATAIECIWEMMENSPFIISRYRATTVSLGYAGDSIANSFCDVLSLITGFYLARWLGLWKSVAVFLIIELLMLWAIRDNLALNILMLLWPIDAIRKWQAGA